MNSYFEKALAARLLWINVRAFEGMAGFETDVENATQAAFDTVDELADDEVYGQWHYKENVPLVLQDVPELAARYTQSYALNVANVEKWHEEEEAEERNRQDMQDIQDTNDFIDAELIAGWKEECQELGLI
ncbi:hypothetical protein [Pseudomonas serbica]|uniref:hypothetical protein n=1 Tax=Pseudomonas serbica TaxID=2965074 RepID=UPI00237AD973|nr:hypothetical protein [Pseudomonas serbica]